MYFKSLRFECIFVVLILECNTNKLTNHEKLLSYPIVKYYLKLVF